VERRRKASARFFCAASSCKGTYLLLAGVAATFHARSCSCLSFVASSARGVPSGTSGGRCECCAAPAAVNSIHDVAP
jgi:hypothetical protein